MEIPENLKDLSEDDFRTLLSKTVQLQEDDRKENQILYYRPNQPKAWEVHRSAAKYLGIAGGNGSGKTEGALAEAAALATGIFPRSLEDVFKEKFRGPIKVRSIVESKTTTLTTVILEKLKWWCWTGLPPIGGDQGHWGWIPKMSLIDGEWDRSWSEKFQLLRMYCRDPEKPDVILGESTWQFMSHNQDASDFASGDFHLVLLDEPPKFAIYRENEARTMRVGGRMILSMTWPDDPGIPVDWIFDQVYEKAQPGPKKSQYHDWFELSTIENTHLDQEAIQIQMENWDETTKKIRIFGGTLRFSNRIHPLFTDVKDWWCFNCGKVTFTEMGRFEEQACVDCQSVDVTEFCHVQEFDSSHIWPTVYLLDPHPRKPHMMLWAQIDPSDDIWIVREAEVDGDPTAVRIMCDDMEESEGLFVPQRLMDPNMGASPASADRETTWQDAFNDAGVSCDLADDAAVGRKTLNQYLRPDHSTLRPRIHIHDSCSNTISQLRRYVWGEWKHAHDKDQKQVPKDKHDDYPTLLKYLMNYNPTFNFLKQGAPILRRPGTRKGAY